MKKTITALGLLLAATLFTAQASASGGEPAGYTETKDPIVLVHGIIGWDSILGVFDYWYGIEGALEDDGAEVYVANLPAMNDDTARGEALIRYLDDLRAIHGHSSFNIIAHSQGALTSKYVAGTRPDLVKSVTTLGGAHQGSYLADVVAGIEPNLPDTLVALLAGVVDAMSAVIDLASGNAATEDSLAALEQLNSQGAASFAERFPNGRPTSSCGQGAEYQGGVYWYSMGGVASRTNLLDPFDLLVDATSLVFLFKGMNSDGIVQRCSTHWGKVIRDDYYLNHADLINHTLGLKSLFSPDVKEIYRQQANRLKNKGL